MYVSKYRKGDSDYLGVLEGVGPARMQMDTALLSGGIELIVFLIAGIELWFGYSMRIKLIATTKNINVLCSVYISQGLSCFSYPAKGEGQSGTSSWEGTQP